MVSCRGLEPLTLWLKVRCSTNWASRTFLWWRMTGSNRRPSACKADALPAELILHLMVAWDGIEPPTQGFSVLCSTDWATKPFFKMAVQTGIEPAISCVTGRHVNRYTTGPFGCGDRTWTCDLRVMSPTSYQLLHPAMLYLNLIWRRKRDSNPRDAFTPCRFSRPIPSAGLGYSSVSWCKLTGGPCRTRTYDRSVMSR